MIKTYKSVTPLAENIKMMGVSHVIEEINSGVALTHENISKEVLEVLDELRNLNVSNCMELVQMCTMHIIFDIEEFKLAIRTIKNKDIEQSEYEWLLINGASNGLMSKLFPCRSSPTHLAFMRQALFGGKKPILGRKSYPAIPEREKIQIKWHKLEKDESLSNIKKIKELKKHFEQYDLGQLYAVISEFEEPNI